MNSIRNSFNSLINLGHYTFVDQENAVPRKRLVWPQYLARLHGNFTLVCKIFTHNLLDLDFKASANVRIASWNQCVFKVGTFARDIRISTERTSSLVPSSPVQVENFGSQGLTDCGVARQVMTKSNWLLNAVDASVEVEV